MQELGGEVALLDYSEESLTLIRSLTKNSGVKLIMGDGRMSPFPSNTFDIVFHQGLLEHFRAPHDLLRENYRILKPGGLLVVDVPQTFHFYTVLKHLLIILGQWFGGWERQFTVGSLAGLLARSGFRPLHVYGDWSRPGIAYKILRQVLMKFGITLPMYPSYLGRAKTWFYGLQERLRTKKILLYTVLSIGVVAQKG